MGIGEVEIKYVREKFEKKYAEHVAGGLYDQRDIDRFRTDDVFVRTYIRGPTRLDEGVDLVHESFRFRKEMEVNDIKATDFEQLIWDRKAVFVHNHDRTGHKILFIRIKEHKRDASLLPSAKRFYLFWLERAFQEAPLERIVSIFDMTECGVSNLDMELTRFVLNCYKFYYPTILEKLLIYEMPWVFNAAWRIIKTWLSAEAISKIKFVTKLDIQDYIAADQLPEHMGGTDKFDTVHYCCLESGVNSAASTPDSASITFEKKRVTFSDSCPSTLFHSFSSEKMEVNANNNAGGAEDKARQNAPCFNMENSFTGRLLTISPAEELIFSSNSSGRDCFDVITLSNTLPYLIAFKIKTTSPEKYRVRPSTGVVKPGEAYEVYVYLQTGFLSSVSKDKFLVMAMEVTGDEYDISLWKTVPKDSIMEHRLKCATVANHNESQAVNFRVSVNDQKPSLANPSNASQDPAVLARRLEMLIESNNQLRRRMSWLIISQIIFFSSPSSSLQPFCALAMTFSLHTSLSFRLLRLFLLGDTMLMTE
ncbi:motile sperm domain-containing protein 2-like isoform X2 [Pomacea canaliculata]|uniref:motile sperm domain-containing protein 2-like isoform X2 n=1 Tax=Pomacea canaliculata TaxID=400727 RepID=UPI000D72C8F5|nr:motile sperm domain-containing protein 2-like isoform X2 [Pomacea canaliculata]